MKKECLSLVLATMALSVPAATSAPSESEKKAVDLLRETIYQYERRRGAVLPPPTVSTNAVPRRGTNAVAANSPSKTIQWSGTPATANVQPSVRTTAPTPTPSPTPTPAPVPSPSPTPTPGPTATTIPDGTTAPAHETTMAELERLYLEGKITAKQFQKYLQQHEQQQQTAAARTPEATPAPAIRQSAPAAQPPPKAQTPPKAAPPSARRTAPPAESPSPDQAAISEVEKKMDELIKAKAARDQQATNISNSATNTVAAGPRTQRQKLDELLRLYIEGKVNDEEYKARREKILSEPGPK